MGALCQCPHACAGPCRAAPPPCCRTGYAHWAPSCSSNCPPPTSSIVSPALPPSRLTRAPAGLLFPSAQHAQTVISIRRSCNSHLSSLPGAFIFGRQGRCAGGARFGSRHDFAAESQLAYVCLIGLQQAPQGAAGLKTITSGEGVGVRGGERGQKGSRGLLQHAGQPGAWRRRLAKM